ncbi:hypothetical protein VTJ83DRAFT_2756 [Remersonia thermophila]|uniref:Trichothecene 3-O-acetyltransferase-like N-terminal domain-containing protein n=1 Tax=Remersonia thermophila TaxID=72144 RepID=A0ABR4DLX4_9PEZI
MSGFDMATEEDRRAWVARLTQTMPLTPIDYTSPQNYIMHCWGFPLTDNSRENREAAAKHLKERLDLTISRLRFLGGVIIHGKDDALPRLVYPDADVDLNIRRFPDQVFDFQVLDSDRFPAYRQLTESGVPAFAFPRERLWLLPKTGPSPGDAVYPVTLRATFIDGGLILGFSFHHGVLDGLGTRTFMERFNDLDPSAPPTVGFTTTLARQKVSFLAYASDVAATTTLDIHNLPDYDFTVPSAPPVIHPAVANVFSIAAATASDLRAAALRHLRAMHQDACPNIFISLSDVVSALTWTSVTRVRLRAGRIHPADPSRFALGVSVRDLVPLDGTPPAATSGQADSAKAAAAPEYLGNMWLRALASSTVGFVTGTSSSSRAALGGPVTPELVGEVAWLIRQAVAELRRPATVARHVAIATRAAGCFGPADGKDGKAGEKKDGLQGLRWPDVDAAIRRSIARHSTGVDMSVGVGLGADVEFDIPGVAGGKGPAAWTRRAYVPFDGFVSILSRKGGSKGDEDWEVWVALREEDMADLAGERELGGWVNGRKKGTL